MNDVDATSQDVVGKEFSMGRLLSGAVFLVKEPKRFFAQMAKTGGFGTPILTALAWIFLATLVEFLVSRFRPQPIRLGLAAEIGWIVLGPFISLVLGFIASGFLFVIWHLMGSKENYETAFRCWAFMTPLAVAGAVLGIVPFLNLVVVLYGAYLLVIASVETHGVASKRAWTVWGILTAFLLVLVGISAILGSLRMRQNRMGMGMPSGFPSSANSPSDMPDMMKEIQKKMEEMKTK